jgi:hypothetical protein
VSGYTPIAEGSFRQENPATDRMGQGSPLRSSGFRRGASTAQGFWMSFSPALSFDERRRGCPCPVAALPCCGHRAMRDRHDQTQFGFVETGRMASDPDERARMTTVRPERPGAAAAIRGVHGESFPTPAEARLVDLLRDAGHLTVSLVAVLGDTVIGHVAFSPVTVAVGAPGSLCSNTSEPQMGRFRYDRTLTGS